MNDFKVDNSSVSASRNSSLGDVTGLNPSSGGRKTPNFVEGQGVSTSIFERSVDAKVVEESRVQGETVPSAGLQGRDFFSQKVLEVKLALSDPTNIRDQERLFGYIFEVLPRWETGDDGTFYASLLFLRDVMLDQVKPLKVTLTDGLPNFNHLDKSILLDSLLELLEIVLPKVKPEDQVRTSKIIDLLVSISQKPGGYSQDLGFQLIEMFKKLCSYSNDLTVQSKRDIYEFLLNLAKQGPRKYEGYRERAVNYLKYCESRWKPFGLEVNYDDLVYDERHKKFLECM